MFLKCRTPKAQRCASHSGYGTRQTLQIYTIDTNVCGNVLSARDGCGSMGTKPRKGDHKNGRFRTEIGKQIAKSMEKNRDRAGGRRGYPGGGLSGGPLYVGFRFSAVFGFFETGDFDVTVPVKGEISEVILKTSRNESALWERETGFLPQSERYGVYVKLERGDIFSVSMSYDGSSSGGLRADGGAWESGKYVFMDNDIMMAAKDAEAPVPFSITAKGKDGTVLTTRELHFDADKEKMYLTVTADGQIVEDEAVI